MNTNYLAQLRDSVRQAGIAARRCHWMRGDVGAGRYMARCALDQLNFMRIELSRLAEEAQERRSKVEQGSSTTGNTAP